MSTQDFGEFTLAVTRKPVAGISQGEIPEGLAALLAEHVPAVLASADHELILTARDEAAAKKLSLYARAWGARQEPKLFIHKIPNKRDMKDNVARLTVQLDSEVVTRAGRPSAPAAEVPAENAPKPGPAKK